MKKTLLVILIIGVIITPSIFFVYILNNMIKYQKVQPKQIWIYNNSENKNPFLKPIIDTIIILEIKNDYALVLKNKDTTSMHVSFVEWNHKLFK